VKDDVVKVDEISIGNNGDSISIAVQGCSHGHLDRIYDTLTLYQEKHGKKIELLLCCGDFQALRNTTDFDTISVPQKYRDMGSFYKYYAGIKAAPILTIVIGGNHEASSYMQELYYGGWMAPNIYYLGASGVVNYRGIRISGISGIYKHNDYRRGRHEFPPYDNSSLRSVYHVRNVEVARLKLLEKLQKNLPKEGRENVAAVDIMLSHDWPRGIEQHGDTAGLIRKKKFFEQEIQDNNLGSPSNEELLLTLKPTLWFSAHLHVKFWARFHHRINEQTAKPVEAKKVEEITENTTFIALESSAERCSDQSNLTDLMTQFLSLDKCLPRKYHLQVVNFPMKPPSNDIDKKTSDSPLYRLHYDLEWLAILQKTHHWTKSSRSFVPDPSIDEIEITTDDIDAIRIKLYDSFKDQTDPTIIPNNFTMTLQPHGTIGSDQHVNQGRMVGNPQTDDLLSILGMNHIITVPYIFNIPGNAISQQLLDENEIDIDEMESTDHSPVDAENGKYVEPLEEDENEIDLDSE
jgi:lariat debranching enzyme